MVDNPLSREAEKIAGVYAQDSKLDPLWRNEAVVARHNNAWDPQNDDYEIFYGICWLRNGAVIVIIIIIIIIIIIVVVVVVVVDVVIIIVVVIIVVVIIIIIIIIVVVIIIIIIIIIFVFTVSQDLLIGFRC